MLTRSATADGSETVYDVLYVDRAHQRQVLGTGLARERAVELAREEAHRRHVGRMFLAGSEPAERGELVVIVESERRAA